MAKNKVQFQKGLSLKGFLERYGTEQKCREALFKLRWPDGFICPECGYDGYCECKNRKLYQCHRCHRQTSLTAGTIYHSSNLPLTTWFYCMYLMTQNKNGISSLELSRQLGVSYNTAWRMKHKIMQVMLERDSTKKLKGHIEMDDAYLGGNRPGQKRGRGTPGKAAFIAAVEKTKDNEPVRMKLTKVKTFSMSELERWSKHHLTPGSVVVSDGLYCFTQVVKAGCIHKPKVTGGGRNSAIHPSFHWVNTMLGNLKNAIRGTYHAVQPKHAARYLSEFQYRFNRRYDLGSMIPRLVFAAARTNPWPERRLVLAENSW